MYAKAGPGTIAEASSRGLPIMLSNYLPGQEGGNVPWVTDGGLGEYSRRPDVIGKTIANWLSDDEKLKSMSAASMKAAMPLATTLIAQEIGIFLLSAHQVNSSKLFKHHSVGT